jgi:two-component system, NarL family, response regulator DevR
VATIRVFLVDDHEIVRRGLSDLLHLESDIEVVGESGTIADAAQQIPRVMPGVVLLDMRLPDGTGIDLLRRMPALSPSARTIMLTSYSDDQALASAISAGAAAYVLKEVRGSQLVNAVRQVAAGRNLMDPAATQRVFQRLHTNELQRQRLSSLTRQERRILELVGRGLTNRQIGEELHLAEKTVKNYVSSILSKLGLERRTQLAVLVARGGR